MPYTHYICFTRETTGLIGVDQLLSTESIGKIPSAVHNPEIFDFVVGDAVENLVFAVFLHWHMENVVTFQEVRIPADTRHGGDHLTGIQYGIKHPLSRTLIVQSYVVDDGM
jgi:hypothetical protein